MIIQSTKISVSIEDYTTKCSAVLKSFANTTTPTAHSQPKITDTSIIPYPENTTDQPEAKPPADIGTASIHSTSSSLREEWAVFDTRYQSDKKTPS